MKPRINIYLDDHVAAQLALLSKRPGLNKSRIVNDALDRFFNPERDQPSKKPCSGGLIICQSHRQRSSAMKVLPQKPWLYLCVIFLLSPHRCHKRNRLQLMRWQRTFRGVRGQVGRRLAQDQSLLNEVLARIVDNRPDLFTSPPSEESTDNLGGNTEAIDTAAPDQKLDDGSLHR